MARSTAPSAPILLGYRKARSDNARHPESDSNLRQVLKHGKSTLHATLNCRPGKTSARDRADIPKHQCR